MLGVTVFQITARLAAMEKRGIIKRTQSGKWRLSREGWRLTGLPRPAETIRVPTEGGSYRPDDSDVPRVRTHDGWRIRHVRTDAFNRKKERRHILYIDPEGDFFTQALSQEPADLIITYKVPGWETRLRRYEHSAIGRKCGRLIAEMIRERKEEKEELTRQEALGL
jgi:hypothetical protein